MNTFAFVKLAVGDKFEPAINGGGRQYVRIPDFVIKDWDGKRVRYNAMGRLGYVEFFPVNQKVRLIESRG